MQRFQNFTHKDETLKEKLENSAKEKDNSLNLDDVKILQVQWAQNTFTFSMLEAEKNYHKIHFLQKRPKKIQNQN